MAEQKPIWYEPHPVTPERKAELRAKGFAIVDSQFMPADHHQDAQPSPAGTHPPDANEGEGAMKVADMRAALTAKGIAIPEGIKKAELRALLESSEQTPTVSI